MAFEVVVIQAEHVVRITPIKLKGNKIDIADRPTDAARLALMQDLLIQLGKKHVSSFAPELDPRSVFSVVGSKMADRAGVLMFVFAGGWKVRPIQGMES